MTITDVKSSIYPVKNPILLGYIQLANEETFDPIKLKKDIPTAIEKLFYPLLESHEIYIEAFDKDDGIVTTIISPPIAKLNGNIKENRIDKKTETFFENIIYNKLIKGEKSACYWKDDDLGSRQLWVIYKLEEKNDIKETRNILEKVNKQLLEAGGYSNFNLEYIEDECFLEIDLKLYKPFYAY